jgi:methyl-accepting chemotaxis protein
LREVIGTVSQTSSTLAGSAESMRSASEQIHRRIDQQSQQTQQAATAMAQMSISIAEVSRHTQSAAETARDAAQTAHEGGDIVKRVLGSMQSIASAVTETSETVGLLGEDSRRISQIVTVIDDIAKKTNLLALNAAIEAARAGEQGRGFAVVAGEVRRLAESTAKATGEIGGMIQGIQQRTRTAVASMESGIETVSAGVTTTNQAGDALERIIGMAERVDRMIAQIAIAASQQSAAATQSSSSLDAIHTLSSENLLEIATTSQGIDGLRSSARAMEEQVDRFVLEERRHTRHGMNLQAA